MRARRASLPVATRQRGTLTAVTLAMFCMEASFLALMLALPDIARSLGETPEVTQDALSAYMLSLGATFVIAGRIGDIAGRLRVFVTGCLLFTVTLIGSALAPGLPVLIAFRLLQGLGAGLMLPAGIALVTAGYAGTGRQARALGLSFALASTGTVIGPFFGGWMAEEPGWRWIFWVLVPFTVLTVAITVRYVPESRGQTSARRLDIPGVAMVALAVAATGTAIDRADSVGWSGLNVALLAAGLGFLALFPLRERRAAHPLIDLSIFRNLTFDLVIFLGSVCYACYAATVFVASLYLQDARGLTAVKASAVFAIMAVLVALAAPIGARLQSHIRPTLVMATAGVIAGSALVLLTFATSWWEYVPVFAICGFGLGLGSSFATIATQQAVGPGRSGETSGILLTILTTSGGISLAAAAGIIDVFEGAGHSIEAACNTTLRIFAFLSLAASLIATAVMYALGRRGLIK